MAASPGPLGICVGKTDDFPADSERPLRNLPAALICDAASLDSFETCLARSTKSVELQASEMDWAGQSLDFGFESPVLDDFGALLSDFVPESGFAVAASDADLSAFAASL